MVPQMRGNNRWFLNEGQEQMGSTMRGKNRWFLKVKMPSINHRIGPWFI
jgi:hypothetical protein